MRDASQSWPMPQAAFPVDKWRSTDMSSDQCPAHLQVILVEELQAKVLCLQQLICDLLAKNENLRMALLQKGSGDKSDRVGAAVPSTPCQGTIPADVKSRISNR